MSLQTYHEKRDFHKTTEPKGTHDANSKGHSYLIQKHDARRLHYDFRLEVGGVLKSWAIPKGPSLDPKDKRLAVQTEDHPLDYGGFEGVIPPPNYGAGTVMLWDIGEWEGEWEAEREGERNSDADVTKALESGKLGFVLHGERLNGRWALVKMKGRKSSGKEWLLIKEHDNFATTEVDPTEAFTDSVVSERSMELIASDGNAPAAKAIGKSAKAGYANRLKKLEHARRATFPVVLKPQLATLFKDVPKGDGWVHEIKYDGYRLLAMRSDRLRLMTRTGKDWTEKFPVIAESLQSFPESILDGELVFLNKNGISSFDRLKAALQNGDTHQLAFYVFDLPYLMGYDLRNVPLLERKFLLSDLVRALDRHNIFFSDHIDGRGEDVLIHACQHQLEGVISKQSNSRYKGVRTKTWRKIKCSKRQEFVIIGFTAPKGSRQGFGALLMAYYETKRHEGKRHERKKLHYAGKVGTGFNSDQLTAMHQQLSKIIQTKSPVDEEVEDDVTWVKPQLVAEVEFTEWTSGNRLRHPVFVALREDKPARDIVREIPANSLGDSSNEVNKPSDAAKDRVKGKAKATSGKRRQAGKLAGVVISNPEKMLYVESGISKQDLAEYYVAMESYILPFVARRPLTLVRCPQGHAHHCFFQKHLGNSFDKSVKPIRISEKSGDSSYAYIDDVQGLVGLVQMGTLEIHTWGSCVDDVEKPDNMVFDLDPDEGVEWQGVKEAAIAVREFLAALGLQSFLRTTGGKGLHVVVPIARRHSWDQVKAFCRAVAHEMTRLEPKRYVATASKARRKNKIFIDYLRNGRGATSICCYSTRNNPGAPVAAPLDWKELDDLASSQVYRLDNILSRMQGLKTDPWQNYHKLRQSITQKTKGQLV